MHQNQWIRAACGLAIGLLAVLASPVIAQDGGGFGGTEPASQPNIIFILTDDLGWGDLGCFYQNESDHEKRHRTPRLDEIAGGGLQMRAHYCPAPVCAPSRSTLFTGVHQGNAVIRDNQFDKELEDNHTLGTVLKGAGYHTGLIGKYGLQGGPKDKQQDGTPADWPGYPTKRGFDEYFGYVSHYAGHLHYPNDPWKLANKGHRGTPNLWHSVGEKHEEISGQLGKCYTTDLFTAKAKDWIVQHEAVSEASGFEQPFFLMLCYDTPHAALQIPTVAYPEGSGVEGGLQWLGQPGKMINTATGTVDSYRHPDYTGKGWTDLEERFATMVRRIDNAVGDLNDTLSDLGIADDTIIVFTSDNGPHREAYIDGDGWGDGAYTPEAFQSYGPFDGIKRDCWEGGIRMPTLAWGAGIREGIDNVPSQFHDWMATFADFAGAAAPARCDGVTLREQLTGEPGGNSVSSTIYIEYNNGSRTPTYDDFGENHAGRRRGQMQVVHFGSYKGVRYDIQSADDDFEIYDLESDPKEAHDLGPQSEYEQQVMKGLVLQLRRANESAPRPYDHAAIPPAQWGAKDIKNGIPTLPLGEQVSGKLIDLLTGGDNAFATRGQTNIHRTYLDVPETGWYEIAMRFDAPAFVRLHGAHLIDADFKHDPAATYRAVRHLKKGAHPLLLTMDHFDEKTQASHSIDVSWSATEPPAKPTKTAKKRK